MLNIDDYTLWISQFDCLTYGQKVKLLSLCKNNLNKFFTLIKSKSKEFLEIMGEIDPAKIIYACTEEYVNNYKISLRDLEIEFFTINSKIYPDILHEVDEPPLVIYYQGNIKLLNSKSTAIVGTRMPSIYGKWSAEYFSKKLSKNGVTIVSGLAYGTDTIVHSVTLQENGKTIAVLASGINNIYPTVNTNLAKEIVAKNGLLITENKPGHVAQQFDFPKRNRLIAAISSNIVITEAGEKSGTYHTLSSSLKLGKDVFVVPGNINSPTSKGCNCMLKSCQTAILLDYDQILENLGITEGEQRDMVNNSLSGIENDILKLLSDGEKAFEYLLENLSIDTKLLNSYLTNLQLLGIIKKLPGNLYLTI